MVGNPPKKKWTRQADKMVTHTETHTAPNRMPKKTKQRWNRSISSFAKVPWILINMNMDALTSPTKMACADEGGSSLNSAQERGSILYLHCDTLNHKKKEGLDLIQS